MSEVTKVAEQLNQKVAQLNNERSRQLGMQEAAKKQYDTAIKAYETKYGVKLTPENLQEEYNKAYKELKTNIEVLKRTIEGIENGEYKQVTVPNIDLEPNVTIEVPEVKVQPTVVETEIVKEEVIQAPEKATVEITPIEEKKEPIFGGIVIPEVEAEEGTEKVEIPSFEGINLVGEVEQKETPVFGGLDFSGFEAPKEEEKVEVKVEETKKEEPVFGGFDFSAIIDSTPKVEVQKTEVKAEVQKTEVKAEVKKEAKKPVNTLNIPTDFVQPAPPKFNGVELEDDEFGDNEEETFAPEGWGTPKTSTDINKNFADILGSQGIKFGE